MEFHLYLPQMRMSFDRLVASARAAGSAGSLVLCDALHHPAVLARQAVSLERARPLVGDARVSVQQMVAYVGRGADRNAVAEAADRRFRQMTPVLGTGPELADHFGRLADQGIERVYAWFADFAPPDTLAAFGAEVIEPLTGHLGMTTGPGGWRA